MRLAPTRPGIPTIPDPRTLTRTRTLTLTLTRALTPALSGYLSHRLDPNLALDRLPLDKRSGAVQEYRLDGIPPKKWKVSLQGQSRPHKFQQLFPVNSSWVLSEPTLVSGEDRTTCIIRVDDLLSLMPAVAYREIIDR